MKTAKLGDLVKITIGRTPSRGNEELWDKDKKTTNTWLSIADLLNADGRVATDSKEYITDKAANAFAVVPQGTLLVSFKLTLGRLAYAGRALRTNEAIAALHNDQKEVMNDYLYHYLSRFDWNDYAKADRKVKGLTLNKAKLAEISITYPESLEEQRRIVARLDAAFEKIDRAIELTEKNVYNVKNIYNHTLDHVFESLEDVTYETLGNIYDVRDGTHDSPKYHKEGYPLVTSKNLKTGILNTDNVQLIAEADYKKINDRSKVSKGDILMAMIGTIGNPIIIDVEPNFAIKNVALFKAPDTQNSSFLKYYLESPKIVSKLLNDAKGSTQKFVSLGYLRSLPFPVIGTPEQNATVRHLHDIEQRTQSAYQLYMKRSKRLQNLKQSLLTQAFSQDKVQ